MGAKVVGYSTGLVWNVPKAQWMNAERNSEPPAIELTCPSQEFLRVLCKACHDSTWCSQWYITGRNGRTIPCSATDIGSLDVDFDEPALPREAEESNNDDFPTRYSQSNEGSAAMKFASDAKGMIGIL
jgi:hypothetical protein